MAREGISKRIGIIGGGQLGKMMALEAKKMGMHLTVLDPLASCPASTVVDTVIQADFNDEMEIRRLAESVDVVTYEFEHIDVKVLKKLEKEGFSVYPSPRSLEKIQNKYTQKSVLKMHDIPCGTFEKVETLEAIKEAIAHLGLPLMLKTCTGGYDGKGNALIRTLDEVEVAYSALGGGQIPLMVEAFVPFEKEVSILACRSQKGEIALYPIGENLHKESILFETRVPAALSKKCEEKAMEIAKKVMEVFEGVGMFCVELFVTKEEVLVNEVAPRPHNSGHYSIEACMTSQFMNHIRAVAGLPLGDTSLYTPVIMRNLLGEEGYEGKAYVEGVESALQISGVALHVYGKEKTVPNRKMGHFTVVGKSLEMCIQKADDVQNKIRVISEA